MMERFSFTLTYKIADHSLDSESVAESLYQYGCDVLAGIGNQGEVALSFSKEAENIAEAISIAHSEVSAIFPKMVLFKFRNEYGGE